MTVVITGRDLNRDELVRVARGKEHVRLSPEARERMQATRSVAERSIERGDAVYGLTTGVGVLKRVAVGGPEAAAYARRLIRHHLVGQGTPAPDDVVRGTMLRLANGFAEGSPGVRPDLAERLVAALNDDLRPTVRILGSVGQADLAQMADLAAMVFDGFDLAAGEGLALVSSNAFSTASTALAVTDTQALLDAMEVAGALSLEALAANPSMLHPAIGEVRPYPGLQRSLAHLRALLEGSFLWSGEAARSLQDPLTFRNLPHIQGACRDALEHVEALLAIELNASQGNPIVVADDGRVVSVANYEILPLAAAADYLRIVLATALSTAAERVVKLLETPWSGLPTGLAPASGERVGADGTGAGSTEAGLSYFGIAVQSLTAEARLLAAPVSFEMTSTSHAEGIEDRTTMAPLAARRLAEMVGLGQRIVAVELVVAAQAAELRGHTPLGRGTSAALAAVRKVVPRLEPGGEVPDVEPLVALIQSDGIGRLPGRQ